MRGTLTTMTGSRVEDRCNVNGHEYRITTNPTAVSFSALNAAFKMFGAEPLPNQHLKKLISTSICFVILYSPEPPSSTTSSGCSRGHQIGFCRLVTDHVVRCDLVEVYVLPEHQKRGLGTWMMGHVEAVLNEMKWLRSCWIVTEEQRLADWYKRTLHVKQVANGKDLQVLVRYGW